ncbi:hypothetical protein T440DRAFT_122715 [Plenodomus tracheiphilus IPT5]|uniref:Uncharacterized protein n=1 Tax=Plenodomus tracheiphilus IPT5 TaxID=1408161 RepID=A0A6A7B5A6_9PLEO|nr:hypothetical protein T440DRAFT_122715 [Plenodomus tracheiphilus IPT5]
MVPRRSGLAQTHSDFVAREDAPISMEDLLSQDTPQISLHVTSSTNAALVALSWPHTLMDVMGQQAFLSAWSLVLAGRESEVPPVLGAREDKLCSIIGAPTGKKEEYILKSKQLKGLAMLQFGARFAWDMLTGPTPETRTVCLPQAFVNKLRRQAQADLDDPQGKEETPFISDGDVLSAWTMRIVASSLPQPRPMTALHAMNARFLLPELVNALFPDVATGPLGPIALNNRQHLMGQATEAQVLASLREQLVTGDPSTLLYSDPNALLMPFTDWTKAKFFHVADFSPAVVRAGDNSISRFNPPGTPFFHQASSRRPNPTARLMVVNLGKDHGDNYWLTLTLSPPAWTKLEESLNEEKCSE